MLNKIVRKPTKNPMEITSTRLFEKLYLNIIGLLPLTESNNKLILTMQCDLMKFLYFVPSPNHKVITIAEELNKFI